MADDIGAKFDAGSLEKGVDTFAPDITPDLQLDIASKNVTSGINQGLGPRYGMAPIPKHSDSEALVTNQTPGLMRAENSSNTPGYTGRTKLFGVFPMRFFNFDFSAKGNFFAWLVARVESAVTYIDLVFSTSYQPTGTYYYPESEISRGLERNIVGNLIFVNGGFTTDVDFMHLETQPVTSQSRENALLALRTIPAATNYVAAAVFQVSGQPVPCTHVLGRMTSAPALTTAPSLNLCEVLATDFDLAGYGVQCGVPAMFPQQSLKIQQRSVTFFCLDRTGLEPTNGMSYQIYIDGSSTYYKPSYRMSRATTNVDVASVAAVKTGTNTGYSSIRAAVMQDAQMTVPSAYTAVAVAVPGSTPRMAIVQDWVVSAYGSLTQWVDPTVHACQPWDWPTAGISTTESYQSCFWSWPVFTRGTSMGTNYGCALGAAGSGILRQNQVYEVAFSLYNKRLNYETNVGKPVKFQGSTTVDFYSLDIWKPSTGPYNRVPFSNAVQNPGTYPVVPFYFNKPIGVAQYFQNKGLFSINFYEYRFYYRPEGASEWLPALYIDAVDFWMKPNTLVTLCAGPVAGLPGGQPGGFVDNSALPSDNYFDVKAWKDRLWWCSEKQVCFSIEKNGFIYPARNSISAGTGEFRGILPHAFPGQSEQGSRLIIFGSKENLVGRFTGVRREAPVQVSADTVGTFEIPDSDFVVDSWTTVTSFSSRSACVADGILYYWGPQGVRRDNGTELPDNISLELEPDIFTLYDPSKTLEIHCTYNDQTKEVTWFYPPKTTDSWATHALTYNTRTGKFLPQKFVAKVDASQKVNIATTEAVAGDRTLVIGRASSATTIQRAAFYDHRNRSGDFLTTSELMVKTIATQGSGKRLTLAAGYDATQFATIAVGDPIAFTQAAAYSGQSTFTDCIVKVTATNAGAGTIDVSVPVGATVVNGTYAQANYIPIWHLGINGLAWQIKTGYWAPGGASFHGIWLYLLMIAKMNLIPSVDAQTISVAYRTMTSGDFSDATDTLELADNCDGNWQVYHPLQLGEGNINGQAIKLLLSGTHIGSEWVLQYLEMHANNEDGNVLKQFEG